LNSADSDDKSAWGWLPLTVQALAAVGALAYSTIHVCFQDFYDQLGVTPESVGASSTTILAQSSLRVIEFGLLFALVPVLVALVAFLTLDHWAAKIRRCPMGSQAAGTTSRGLPSSSTGSASAPGADRKPENGDATAAATFAKRNRTLRRIVLALVAVLAYSIYQWLTDGRTYSYVILFSFAALVALGWLRRGTESLSLSDVRHGSAAVVVVLWIGLTVCWVVLTSLSDDATQAGICARHGVAVRYIHTHRHLPFFARIPVLRVQAEPVEPADAALLGGQRGTRQLYLGQSSGTAVLWDVNAHRAILIPSSTVIRLTPLRRAPPPGAACHRAHIS
jgi:hypothetical protein